MARPEKVLVGRSVHFENAGRLDDRRLLLALRKALRAVPIDVHTRELLAVVVVHRHLPVPMLAAAVPVKSSGLASLGLLSHSL